MGRCRAAAAAAAAALALASNALAASQPLRTGLVAGPEFAGQDARLAFERARAAGATSLSIPVAWSAASPVRPPSPRDPASAGYDWTVLDREVVRAVAHGLAPLLVIQDAPEWAQDRSASLPFTPADPSLVGPIYPSAALYGDFAAALAERYSGSYAGLPRVRDWRAWNEPNLSSKLLPQFSGATALSPDIYRAMVNAFAAAVHAVHPDNVVVAGGLAPFGSRTRFVQVVAPLRFMRELFCMGDGAGSPPTCADTIHADAWAVQPYTTGGPTKRAAGRDDVSLGNIPDVARLVAAAAHAGRIVSRAPVQVLVSEFAWDTRPPDVNPRVAPIDLQARWLDEALYRMSRLGVTLATWFQLRDEPLPAGAYQSGLYFNGGARLARDAAKPALPAFRFPFVAYRRRGGVLVWGRSPGGRAASIVVEQNTGSGWQRLASVRTDRYGLFTRVVRLRPPPVPRVPVSRTASYAARVRRDRPRFYWRLDETGGAVARDATGRRNAVYAGRPASVPGALPGDDRAVRLNGRRQRVLLGTLRSPRTVELWLRTQATVPTAAFSNRDAASGGTYLGLADAVHALAFEGSPLESRAWITDGRWHHLVYTFDGALGRLYVDGRLEAEGLVRGSAGVGTALLGYDRTLRRYLKGSIDEVAVYAYPLTAAQVRAHFLASGRSLSYGSALGVLKLGQTYLRARLANRAGSSLPFSLTAPPDRFVLPFGT